ncbi:hypothetical protein [Kaistia adipata]|uniref:hypothetical protein n=1 Tax=Kaistia adipata TaxID=166954 RepID=UPI0012EBB4B8|nr:hypothetical protein [Kaistia adipata]
MAVEIAWHPPPREMAISERSDVPKLPRQTLAAIGALLLIAAVYAALPAEGRSPARAFAELASALHGR